MKDDYAGWTFTVSSILDRTSQLGESTAYMSAVIADTRSMKSTEMTPFSSQNMVAVISRLEKGECMTCFGFEKLERRNCCFDSELA